jgi:hypothetical protein
MLIHTSSSNTVLRKTPFRVLLTGIGRVLVLLAFLLSLAGESIFSVQAKSNNVGFRESTSSVQTRVKEPLERLQNLITASEAYAAAPGDLSYLAKLDSHLQDLVSDHLSGIDIALTAQANDIQVTDDQNVLVDIYVSSPLDQAVNELKELGMQVAATNMLFGVVEGYLPVNSVLAAASLKQTKAFLPVMAFGVDTGSVTSEGDAAHNGPTARSLGANGAGVVVGIISDSMNQVGTGVAGSQGTGDLPPSISILHDYTSNPTDEGRAMAEIIYDTAPGITSMFFETGLASGPAGKATAINNLVSHGVDVIADDTFYLYEPFFQDGMVANAVDAAYNSGVAYFVSAGNLGSQSYESNFRNDGFNDHDFDPGAGSDWLQTIATIPSGGDITIVLQWDDPWGAATHDLDFYLANVNTMTLLSYGASDNIVSGLPVEIIYWYNNTGSSVTVGGNINLWSGTNDIFLKYIASVPIYEYNTSSNAIDPGAASAKGAMTVAAVHWNEFGLNDPEDYSSRGPVTRLFNTSGVRLGSPEVRQKPNVAGADCVSTSSNFSGGIGFGGGTFCGTSAAAPSVAGLAALVLSDTPSTVLIPSVLYSVLEKPTNTIDCAASGNPDYYCGYGFVLADEAVTWARSLPEFDVFIGGSLQGSYGIPTGESHRLSYDLNNGPLRVKSTDSTNIISSERVVWLDGYDELMGYPVDQLTTEYLFPWYNNVAMNSQLRVGNTGSVAADVEIYIGNEHITAAKPYTIPVGGSVRLAYLGMNNGPVRIVTTTPGASILASERVIWLNGYDELMGYPVDQLTTEYLFPWYNDYAMNSQLRVGNTGNVAANVDVYIGNEHITSAKPYTIPVGGSVRLAYPGMNDGPVRIVTTTPGASILASERVIWLNGYDELMGYSADQLTNEYVFPLYTNVSKNSQLRIGNTGNVAADVDVYLGDTKVNGTPYNIPVGGSQRLSYTGLEGGPLRVVTSTAGASILATERVINGMSTGTGYDELMGYASNALKSEYLFPWYNNYAMTSDVIIGVP